MPEEKLMTLEEVFKYAYEGMLDEWYQSRKILGENHSMVMDLDKKLTWLSWMRIKAKEGEVNYDN